jgi:hypothetical protein
MNNWRKKLLWNLNVELERGDSVIITQPTTSPILVGAQGVILSKVMENYYTVVFPHDNIKYTFPRNALKEFSKYPRIKITNRPLVYIDKTFEIGDEGFLFYRVGGADAGAGEVYFDNDNTGRIVNIEDIELI